ncbi:DedA family protein [Rhodococcus sp. D2-41]|uniref:DedA family protein n=1 Tax=Speluncibacter jeojiensis TaxID=2710754 RepID=A0A9X4RJ92_9ACTN|nr:DedA family protein [Rhodococcus sp. D2-41]MDG3009287.1 DedA family protein [Rhodococcus sp. D2-41]MDG3016926.1 DedA family protein [Corynebacteriales bacterium D3-21]
MQQFIVSAGYLAVFLLMFAESACIPIPSEVTMLFAGALAGGAVAGAHLNIVWVIVLGALGNVAGSYLAWAVGRYAGRAALYRWGRKVWLREDDIDKAHDWFVRHGPVSVFAGRLLPVIRTFISLPAGFAAMPAVRFGIYTTAGCLLWSAVLALIGYAIGANWHTVADGFHGPTYVIAAIVAVVVVALGWRFVQRRRAAAVDAG